MLAIIFKFYSMKSKIVLLLVAVAFTSLAFGQLQQGSWIVSGNSSLQVTSSKVEGDDSSATTVIFSPSIGYFVVDGLAVGIGGNVLNSEGFTTYSVLPSASYYFLTQSPVRPFIQVGVGYSGMSVEGESIGGLALGAGAGITYLINQHVGFNLGLQYLRGEYSGAVNNTFGGALGFSLFF